MPGIKTNWDNPLLNFLLFWYLGSAMAELFLPTLQILIFFKNRFINCKFSIYTGPKNSFSPHYLTNGFNELIQGYYAINHNGTFRSKQS